MKEKDKLRVVDGMEKKVTEVVAALIWEGGRFLICQRPAHKARGLLWEFVGGKIEPGESKEQALARECREELAITISVGEVFMEIDHDYPDLNVHLTLSTPDIVAVEQVLTFWVAVAKEEGNAEITVFNSTGECGTVTLTAGAAANPAR